MLPIRPKVAMFLSPKSSDVVVTSKVPEVVLKDVVVLEFKSGRISPEVPKFVWLKYAPAKVTGPTFVRAKIPVPVCSFPSESIATVHGVVKPCLPTFTVVLAIPVYEK
jgi:hypothetical protein